MQRYVNVIKLLEYVNVMQLNVIIIKTSGYI